MERKTLFADVLLPLPLPGYFTYRVPYELNNQIEVGQRVVVQFGSKKIYTALVRFLHENAPEAYVPKYVLAILDAAPIVNKKQFATWEWIASYYLCSYGEVMSAALPSALKLASETKLVLHPDFDGDLSVLNENEYRIAEALHTKPVLTVSEVTEITGLQKVIPLLKTLIEKKVALVEEELTDRFKPKSEQWVRLADEWRNEQKLNELFDQLEKKSEKQNRVLQVYFMLAGSIFEAGEVRRKDILKKFPECEAQIKALGKKGVFEILEKSQSRLIEYSHTAEVDELELSLAQQSVMNSIQQGFQSKDTVLLHGVTSSGKTEIYIRLINETIKAGKQVLYLLPEIALTAQTINRLRKYFGNRVGIYHSKYNEHERVEIWNKVLGTTLPGTQPYQVVLGARSAMFLPFDNLGLIIVDEEHDSSYKQFDPAPRYNARDAAIWLGNLHKAKVLLGSATPSIESYYNAKAGKYHLVELSERFGGMLMPLIEVADLTEETKRKTMKSHFSSLLFNQIEEALANQEQIILFQNRRGFSVRIECDSCHHMPQCKKCDVTLIYHKHNNQLKCHYCGYSIRLPEKCPACGSTALKMKGFGTERIEEEISLLFPNARVARMDLDTTRSKNAYRKIISDFEEREIDILVGTQMITKGLDFDNVSVVGILNADNMISFPDFRSYERSFQQLAQVSGRAGRKNKRGKVIIQSYNPYFQVIRDVIDNNYAAMYSSQIVERNTFKYPPFFRLVKLIVKHPNEDLVNEAAAELGNRLRKLFDNRVLGPEFPLVSRINNYYLKNIILKFERDNYVQSRKNQLQNIIRQLLSESRYKPVKVTIDVDPY